MNSEYDSDSSNAPSPSPPGSPSASLYTLPNTERLLQHFVSAKRSLGSSNYVSRANELVTSSRTLVEEIAVLNARNTFTEREVADQVDILHSISDEASAVGDHAGDNFQETISRLDQANDRLERTLNALKRTIVDTSLQGNGQGIANGSEVSVESEESQQDIISKQSLYDFIDESNHADLQASLRALIDSFNDSRTDLDTSVNHFRDILRTITEISSGSNRTPGPGIGNIYDEPLAPVPQLFRGMEDHAAEMAKLLEGLVVHYDLCVTALKHTEGGGEAAKRAMQQVDESLMKAPAPGIEESLYLKSIPEPISTEERNEMLRVLENDAQEVEDVASELKDRNRDQESLYEQLSQHAGGARSKDRALRQVMAMLHEIQDIHLPSHLLAISTFKDSWKRVQTSIESQASELASLSSFYDSFLVGYGKLLQEVERRRAAESQMRKVAEKARRDLEKLHKADKGLRADFMEETGKYLPQGIWSGLMAEGSRWELAKQDGE